MQQRSMRKVVVLLTILGFAVGCGKKTEEKKTEEKKTDEKKTGAANGGPKKPSSRALFIGTWDVTAKVDEAKMMADLKKDDLTGEDLKKEYESIKKIREAIKRTYTFNADGTLERRREISKPGVRGEVESMKWEIISEEGKKVTLKIMAGRRTNELKLTIVDNNNLSVHEISNSLDGTMTFKRK